MPKIKPARHRPPEANSGEAGGDVIIFIKQMEPLRLKPFPIFRLPNSEFRILETLYLI